MLSAFEKKIAAFIASLRLFDQGREVLLAVSGGADSVALMFAMLRLTKAGVIEAGLSVAHVNHKLRPHAADEDEEFVLRLGEKAGLEVVTRSVDVRTYARDNGLSIETAARQLRSATLIDIAKAGACKSIATAHHKDDSAETMLHRLLRGTAFRGLGGIWPTRTFDRGTMFVRPLLCVTRTEIIQYCRTNSLKWRHDHTNDDCSYTRNRIRHLLLPKLQKNCDGSLIEELAKLSTSCQSLYTSICRQTEKIWPSIVLESQPDKVVLDKKVLTAQPPIVGAELARRAIVNIGSGERGLKETHYNQVLALAGGPGGRRVELPGGFEAVVDYEQIVFQKARPCAKIPAHADAPAPLRIPGETEFGGYNIKAELLEAKDCDIEKFKAAKDESVEWFDFDKLPGPLVARRRWEGDRFRPLGGPGAKKIGKFLTTAKVPRRLRPKLIIIANGEKIIWLAPLRTTEPMKITGKTRTILQLKICPG
jgi:tRNA(Ile)-lysidine synthase